MQRLDQQLAHFANRLRSDVGLTASESGRVATHVAADIRFLAPELKSEIRSTTPVPIKCRLEELLAFQSWMDQAAKIRENPAITRAQVIVQNYVCFVYLGEACFRVLTKHIPRGSVSGRCLKFLTDNPIRAFRNSIAHGNWRYDEDFTGIIYWARKGADPSEPLTEFRVSGDELNFWQALARCVGYAVYLNV